MLASLLYRAADYGYVDPGKVQDILGVSKHQTKKTVMEDTAQLTLRQIVLLASAISANDMPSIAEGYLDIDPVTIKNIRQDTSSSGAFNRDIIRYWMYKNPWNQVQVRGLVYI